jgi:hypothetical protein
MNHDRHERSHASVGREEENLATETNTSMIALPIS